MKLIGRRDDKTIQYLLQQLTSRHWPATVSYIDDISRGEALEVGGSKVFCRWFLSQTDYANPDLETAYRALSSLPLERVAGHPAANPTNFAKFVHLNELKALCTRHGLRLPMTIVGNRKLPVPPGDLIIKGISGRKSIASALSATHRERSGHYLVQERIIGPDVRVHGTQAGMCAETIASEAVDYRFATRKGFLPAVIPGRIQDFCRSLAKELGLAFYGADFKVAENGDWYFLEVNSSPAFQGYDRRSHGAITTLLCSWDISDNSH